jgi:hypothetical protein
MTRRWVFFGLLVMGMGCTAIAQLSTTTLWTLPTEPWEMPCCIGVISGTVRVFFDDHEGNPIPVPPDHTVIFSSVLFAAPVSVLTFGPGIVQLPLTPVSAPNPGSYPVIATFPAQGSYGESSDTNACIMQPVPLSCDASCGPCNYCRGQGAAQLQGGGAGGYHCPGSPYSVEWTPHDGLDDPFLWNPQATPDTSTLYTLSVTDCDTPPATSTCGVMITVSDPPTASITPDPARVCASADLALLGVPSGGTPPYVDDLWTGPGATYLNDETLQNPTFNAPSAGTYNLTYWVTDSLGCMGSASIDVTVDSNPTVSVADVETCEEIPTAMTADVAGSPCSVTSYDWTGPGGFTAFTQEIAVSTAGTYTVTVVCANGCTATDSGTLTVHANPTAGIGPTAVCADVDSTLHGNPVGGSGVYTDHLWTGPGAMYLSATDVEDPTFNGPAGTHSLTYTVTDDNGCQGTDTVLLQVYANPTAAITPDPSEVCAGDDLGLYGNPSGGSGVYTDHLWIGPGAVHLSATDVEDPMFSAPATAGSYDLTYWVTDSNGCMGSDDITITVQPNPAVSVADAETCEGIPTTMTADVSGSPCPVTSYDWTGPGGFTVFTQDIVVTTGGTYAVVVGCANGCTATDSGTLTVHANPTAGITPDPAETHEGIGLQLHGNPAGGSGVYVDHLWTGVGAGHLDDPTLEEPTFTVLIAGDYPLTYTVTDSNGCQGQDDIIVTVLPPVMVRVDDAEICEGSSTTMTADTTGTICTIESYAWTGPGGFTADTQTIVVDTEGTYTVVVRCTTGTTATDSGNLTVHANPTAGISPNSTCVGVPTQLHGNPQGGAGLYIEHLWTGAGAAYLSASDIEDPIFTGPAGTHALTYTVTDSNGCQGTDTVVFQVYPNPTANITPDPALVCTGQDLQLHGNPSGGSGIYVGHLWTGPGTTYLSATDVEDPTFHAPASAGSCDLTYWVTDSNGCMGSDDIDVVVEPSPTVRLADATICEGHPTTMTADTNGSACPVTSYNWTGPDGFTAFTQDIVVDTAGTYTVTVSCANGCTATEGGRLIVYANPTADIISGPVCAGEDSQFHGNPAGGSGVYVSHSWTGTGAPYLSSTIVEDPVLNAPAGNYTLTYTVTDSRGCQGSDTVDLDVYPNPTATITPNPAITRAGVPIALHGNPSGGSGVYVSHRWIGNDIAITYLSATDIEDPTFDAPTGAYTLTYIVTDSNGCIGSDTVPIQVENVAPIAEDQFLRLCANESITVLLRASDPDVDPENPQPPPLSFTIYGPPMPGATVSGDLGAIIYEYPHTAMVEVRYTPPLDFVGVDRFIFLVRDRFGAYAIGTIQIELVPCDPNPGDGPPPDPGDGAPDLAGSVIINEVAWGGTEASSKDEWIELLNRSNQLFELDGWVLRWRRKQPATPEETAWKQIELMGWIQPQGYYLLERRHDDVVKGIKADLIYDTDPPYSLELSDLGEVMQLVDADGVIIDTANIDHPNEDGWPAGTGIESIIPFRAMERVDPLLGDHRENWGENTGAIINGVDANRVLLDATATMLNESTIVKRLGELTPQTVRAGEPLSITISSSSVDGSIQGLPRFTLARVVETEEGAELEKLDHQNLVLWRLVKELGKYEISVATSNLDPGTYWLWISMGNRTFHYLFFEVVER